MTEPVVRTEAIAGSPLARAAADGRLTTWYLQRPTSAQGWAQRADAVRASAPAHWLDRLGPAFGATGAAAARLARVGAEGGVVVTTGQQPGLFGGPIYTWSKALTALAIADEIEAATGVAAAPVFWAATDDADFAEASWTAVAVTGGAERLAVAAGAPLGRPMAEMPLGDVELALDALVRACGGTVDAHPIDVARAAYRPAATVGGAYVAFLRELFEPLEIAVLDASHPAVLAVARPFLIRALGRADAVAAALRDRDEAIRAAGYVPQVVEVAGLSLVFERPASGGDKRRVPLSEAPAVAATGDTARSVNLSPNVLLRPVIERAILPTISYAAGPGEIAYFAQVSAVASALDLEVPLVVPRWSTTIVEPHIARILGQLRLDEAELADPHRAEGRVARDSIPQGVARALNEFRSDIARRAATLGDAVRDGALPVPGEVVSGAQRSMQLRLERLERRIVAAAKRREVETMTQIGTARGALYPFGTRQERVLNIVPFLARHGSVIVDRMRSAARQHAQALVGTGQPLETAPR